MFKILWLLKRKPGITPQEFRERYERHARLGQKHVGHLILSYKRKYKTETWGGGTPTTDGGKAWGPIEWDYDCITEVVYPNEEAYHENQRIHADPVIGKEFFADEEDFLDRKAVILFKFDEVDTGSPGAPKN
jgi:hypothetical protein